MKLIKEKGKAIMNYQELMKARYSVRKFKPDTVSDDVVLMQIGHPADDFMPVAWHFKCRPDNELFATL